MSDVTIRYDKDAGVWVSDDAGPDAIRRAAYLECAEIAEREAHESRFQPSATPVMRSLCRLGARYRQMAEGSGG